MNYRQSPSLLGFITALLMVCLCLLACPTVLAADMTNVVLRQTDDRNQDLIDALIRGQRFDEAIALCASEKQIADPRSDEAAKWAIRWSHVLAKKQEANSTFDAQAVTKAQQPVAELLQAYGDHRRALFLEAQLAQVDQTAAKHAVVIASVSPNSAQQTEQVFTQLARTTQRFVELAAKIDAARATLDGTATTPDEKSMSADVLRLHNELRIDIVSMALLQTDLFPPESRDQLSAANKARQAAEAAVAEIPQNSPARLEIERLRVQAILRSGDYTLAGQSLIELARQYSGSIPHRILALRVELDLAQKKLAQAESLLLKFYGDRPDSAPSSIEMDLARLGYLIAAKDDWVGTWLESIEKRHGAYARRRAEAISLGNLRNSTSTEPIDPSIIAAQGSDWLRRGEPLRAAKLLAAAAQAETKPELAIKRALESAAAYTKSDSHSEAASVLSSISLKHHAASQAADVHLQAALLLSQTQNAEAANAIESILLQTHRTWPKSDAGAKARRWLLTLLDRQDRKLELTQAATSFLNETSSKQDVSTAFAAWREMIAKVNSPELPGHFLQFKQAFAPLDNLPLVQQLYPLTAAFILDRSELANLSTSLTSETDEEKFAAAFLAFRLGQPDSPTMLSPPDSMIDAARWRLLRDGELDSAKRKPIAELLSKWGGSWEDQIPVKVWADDIDGAMDLAKQAAEASDRPAKVWQRLATSLGESSLPESQRRGIEVWDQLAAGSPKGSPPWHEAKLAAIELMVTSGDRQEAARRAKYVLLTQPPSDANLLRRYESASKP
ncbi:MAG: hypothetical protein WBD20_10765 [Pirellulaceae bacterium]